MLECLSTDSGFELQAMLGTVGPQAISSAFPEDKEPLLPDFKDLNYPEYLPTLVLDFDGVLAKIGHDVSELFDNLGVSSAECMRICMQQLECPCAVGLGLPRPKQQKTWRDSLISNAPTCVFLSEGCSVQEATNFARGPTAKCW